MVERLHATPTALSNVQVDRAPALAHLEASLFRGSASGETGRAPSGGVVDLLEAPDRAGEVRAAMRWLKERVVVDGMGLAEVALLARSTIPYRDFVEQIAAEFALPVRLVAGAPLRGNPAIAALLDLMRLTLPLAVDRPEPALPRRLLVEAWRSPYFDWSVLESTPGTGSGSVPGGATGGPASTADALDAVAYWSRITGGQAQWEQGLARLVAFVPEEGAAASEAGDAPSAPPERLPTGARARALLDLFHAWLDFIRPPAGQHDFRDFVRWLEKLIGDDPAAGSSSFHLAGEPGLRVVARARQGATGTGRTGHRRPAGFQRSPGRSGLGRAGPGRYDDGLHPVLQ